MHYGFEEGPSKVKNFVQLGLGLGQLTVHTDRKCPLLPNNSTSLCGFAYNSHSQLSSFDNVYAQLQISILLHFFVQSYIYILIMALILRDQTYNLKVRGAKMNM